MKNFSLFLNITSKNKTEFSDCTDRYNNVETAD